MTKKESKIIITILRDYIKETGYTSSVKEENIIIEDLNMVISFNLVDKKQYQNKIIIQINFAIFSILLGEEIRESVSGVGNNEYEAIKNSLELFTSSIFIMLLNCFKNNDFLATKIETSFGLKKLTWNVGVSSINQEKNNSDNDQFNFLDLIKDTFSNNLGNKLFYVIKVNIFKMINEPIVIECSINNEPYLDAIKIIKEYFNNLKLDKSINLKQYIILKQSNNSYLTKLSILDLKPIIEQSISVLEEDDTNIGYKKIYDLVNNQDLALELYTFIPLVYCMLVFDDISYGDNIIIKIKDKKIRMKLSQVYIFNIIKQVIYGYLQTEYNEARVTNILMHNTMFLGINKALNEGSKLEDLYCDNFIFKAHRNYNPYH